MASQTSVTTVVSSEENDSEDIGIDNSRVYDGVEITEKKKAIVEYLARNPNATNRATADATECSISYPSRVRDQYGELILARADELGTDLDDFDESDKRRQQKRADQWMDLTDKQQAVLRRLAEEPDPSDPASSLRDIVEDLEFDEQEKSQTHPSYIADVKEKYSNFAKQLQYARRVTDTCEEAEMLIDDIDVEHISDDDMSSDINDVADDAGTEAVDESVSSENISLDDLLDFVQMHKKMAQSELDSASNSDVAAGRFAMAEQFENKLSQLNE